MTADSRLPTADGQSRSAVLRDFPAIGNKYYQEYAFLIMIRLEEACTLYP